MKLMICLWVFAATGCAIWETPEVDSEKTAVPVSALESTPGPEPREPELAVKTDVSPRVPTREDIRRTQIRLKELGFDPGPADGILGTRTKTALSRLQTSCSKWQSLNGSSGQSGPQALDSSVPSHRIPSRQETQMVQTQLRSAGFNPGPVDGIFGAQTKSVWLMVTNTCPMLNDFAGILDRPIEVSAKPVSVRTVVSSQAVRVSNNEEIRILQLRLRDAGFDPGPFDGIMGPKTKFALRQYEASQRGRKTKITLTTANTEGQY
jgi:peptidoglycan hydrolase-like protein with peptidoglycan-binding domain